MTDEAIHAEPAPGEAEHAGGDGAARSGIAPLVVSAPFGNYVQPPGVTPTLGTFTRLRRPGRLWRIVKTVRYYPRLGVWVNRIGLRNPGIDWLGERVAAGRIDVRDKLISVHGFEADDWWTLIDKASSLRPLGVELNISCPNVGELTWPGQLFERAARACEMVVVKLPPVRYERIVDEALAAGVRAFHCCNTLPVRGGGMSGEPLRPLVLGCLTDVRAAHAEHAGADDGATLTLIAGGGVYAPEHAEAYTRAGATNIAIGSVLMSTAYMRYARSRNARHPNIDAIKRAAETALGQ